MKGFIFLDDGAVYVTAVGVARMRDWLGTRADDDLRSHGKPRLAARRRGGFLHDIFPPGDSASAALTQWALDMVLREPRNP